MSLKLIQCSFSVVSVFYFCFLHMCGQPVVHIAICKDDDTLHSCFVYFCDLITMFDTCNMICSVSASDHIRLRRLYSPTSHYFVTTCQSGSN